MRPTRFALAALLAVSFSASALIGPSLAQNTDVIQQRQQLMKENGKAAKAASDMIKGTTPYDAAKAVDLFKTINADTQKFATLFPEDSKTGGKTSASPAIWEKPAEFKAANAKMIADSQAGIDAAPADVDAFKTAFTKVASNCQSCHQQFRVKN